MFHLSTFRRACAAALLITGLIGIGGASAQDNDEFARATLYTADGVEVGSVSFADYSYEEAGAIGIWAEVHGLEAGFHGFHIHAVGSCDATTERPFSSAGGHMHHEDDGATHGQHAGDLPSLLVLSGGRGLLATATDSFTIEQLLDEDGSAVIIHAGADNFGNIPLDRYDPDPDETTLNTGDAGGRIVCGVVEAVGD